MLCKLKHKSIKQIQIILVSKSVVIQRIILYPPPLLTSPLITAHPVNFEKNSAWGINRRNTAYAECSYSAALPPNIVLLCIHFYFSQKVPFQGHKKKESIKLLTWRFRYVCCVHKVKGVRTPCVLSSTLLPFQPQLTIACLRNLSLPIKLCSKESEIYVAPALARMPESLSTSSGKQAKLYELSCAYSHIICQTMSRRSRKY